MEFDKSFVWASILWRSGLELLMDNFLNFLQNFLPATRLIFRFRALTESVSMDFHQTWYVH